MEQNIKVNLEYVRCSNKKCTAHIGVLPEHANMRHFCSDFCGTNERIKRKFIIVPKKKEVRIKRPKRTKEDFEYRRDVLRSFKNNGHTNKWMAEKLGVDRATVSCYISGRYNIVDEKWLKIKEMMQ